MYRIEVYCTDKTIKVISNLFEEEKFDIWKFKDKWMQMFYDEHRYIHHNNKFVLIRNSDDKILLNKTINNGWYRSSIYYRRNMIYETVRKDMKFDFYKEDEHHIKYRVIDKSDKSHSEFIGVCLDLDIEGTPENTANKAFTNVKKKTHEVIFQYGLEKMMSTKKKKKK